MSIESVVVPLKIKVPFRIVSVIFAIIAVLTLFTAALSAYQGFYGRLFMYSAYAGANLIIAFGFWKMRKWIFSLFIAALAVVTILDVIGLILDTKTLTQALFSVLVVGIFTGVLYFLRNRLNGTYKQYKVMGSFVGLLALAQIAIAAIK